MVHKYTITPLFILILVSICSFSSGKEVNEIIRGPKWTDPTPYSYKQFYVVPGQHYELKEISIRAYSGMTTMFSITKGRN